MFIFLILMSSLVALDFLFFFFFKQKTAYEMRISDWSSDVCSSDLLPIPPSLHMSSVPRAPLQDLACDWLGRVANAPSCHPASDVYCGRSFQEARAAAAAIDAKLIIVSAGLGLVEASTPIPAYGCTVLVGADDGIQSRVDGTFSIASWWRALSSSSHLSRDRKS